MRYLCSLKNSDTELSVISESPDETYLIGKIIGRAARPGLLVLLKGTLGTGKTRLTQGIGEALGVNGIKSPTFIIMNEYDSKIPLLHADLYRLDSNDAIESLGIDEYLEDGFIAVVEWAQLWETPPQECRIDVELNRHDENSRTIKFTYCGNNASDVFYQISEEIKKLAGVK
ncbi:MAG: tRNA (adenosine(37)-N6)-threonylcarbamoyltransferase complex ATPase subunit type 1 TsaE [Synergistes sp.]|nr:tRNA (adenosine(37)-N6)-threonylcarbamoyltransferase complex ATPase subunit type 1 TsaE [Synergistes sp.]